MTNVEFAKNDAVFVKACAIGKVEATPRQASKWRNKKGTARKFVGSATSWVMRRN